MRSKKKLMMQTVLMAASTLLFTMCVQKGQVLPENPDIGDEIPDDVPDDDPDEFPEQDDTLYFTALEYPEGYDWVHDAHKGKVKCTLFVEKEGERILEVPIGDAYETASDFDMHRFIKGHLYTDYATRTETVIKKDGVDLFRYPGREFMRGFLVSESGDVYTVCRPMPGDGDGFVFRKNGQALLSVDVGTVLSDIIEENGHIYLVYQVGDKARSVASGYYLYDNGNSELFATKSAHKKIYCATLGRDGSVCYVGSDGNSSTYAYYEGGEKIFDLDPGQTGSLVFCEMSKDEDCIYLRGRFRKTPSDINENYIVWNNRGQLLYSLPTGHVPLYTFTNKGNIYDMVNKHDDKIGVICYKNGAEIRSYGSRTTFYGVTPAAKYNGHLYLLYSDRSDNAPLVNIDGEVKKADFNGYYADISIW